MRTLFHRSPQEKAGGRAVEFLVHNNENRFWTVLERQLLEGRNKDARDLLLSLAEFQIHRKTYPKGLGRSLLRLIQSLPPETRRLKIDFPLLPMPNAFSSVSSPRNRTTKTCDSSLGLAWRKDLASPQGW